MEKKRSSSFSFERTDQVLTTRDRSVSEVRIDIPIKDSVHFDRKMRRSHEHPKKTPSVPVIDEEKEIDLTADERYASNRSLASNVSDRASRSGSHRKVSKRDSPSTISESVDRVSIKSNGGGSMGGGHVNPGFNGSTTGSVNSMTVVREQYCSCMRWSKKEKTLVLTVSILAIVVMILVIVVGVLAKDRPDRERHLWVF